MIGWVEYFKFNYFVLFLNSVLCSLEVWQKMLLDRCTVKKLFILDF